MKLLTSRSVTVQLTRAKTLIFWIDSPDRSVNILDANVLSGISKGISYAESNSELVRVVMFCSRKSSGFFAGADVHAIAKIRSTPELHDVLLEGSDLFDRIAKLNAITIAAIDGVCLGGGLELALACDFRIASNSSQTRLGLPEVKLGLLPGWGGTQRLPRLIGLKNALPLILKGSTVDAAKAYKLGLVDKLFEREHWESDVVRFAAYIASVGWERDPRDRTWNDWFIESTPIGRSIARRSALRQVASHLPHHPALAEIIDAAIGAFASQSLTYEREHKAFERLLFTATAQNMLSVFTDRDRSRRIETWVHEPIENSDSSSEDAIPPRHQRSASSDPNDSQLANKPFECVGIMGAGAMGAGIGVLAAKKGYSVVFREVSIAAAEAGWDRIEKLLQYDVEKRRLSEDQYIDILGRITVATDLSAVVECELIVEAVLEIESIKRELFNTLDRILPADSIFASNTSSLGIARMGSATRRPSQIAGLHFFNPVEQMELVEVVRTPSTSDETTLKLLRFAKDLGKTPIVTSDQPGFLVNRILFPYLGEAVRMALDGTPFHVIDGELTKFGMPMGPLELLDQVGVDVAAHVAKSLREILPESKVPADVLEMMVGKGWLGKKSGLGFYDYKIPGKRVSNHELLNRFGKGKNEGIVDYRADGLSVIQRRLVYAMINEAFRCLEDQVICEPWIADLGMILGCGFAPHTGGPLRLVDAIGPRTVHHNMTRLARLYGERYRPSECLSRLTPNDRRVYESIDYCRVPIHTQCASQIDVDSAVSIS